jgi:hypothetical protein
MEALNELKHVLRTFKNIEDMDFTHLTAEVM